MKILYIIFLIAAAVFYPLFRDDLSFILLCTLLIFPAVMLVLLIAEVRAVKIRVRDFPGRIVRGEKLCMKIHIRNPLFVPVSCCAVTVLYRIGEGSFEKYVITIPLRARSSENVELSIIPKHCGAVECLIKKAVFYDFIGLLSKGVKLDISMTAAVMPREYPFCSSGEDDVSSLKDSSSAAKLSVIGGPAEVSGLRDYRDGDRINSIHWKLSSRSESFIVKEFSEPAAGTVLVIPDVCSSEDFSAKDRIMDVYFSLMKCFSDGQRDVKVLMNDENLTMRSASAPQELEELIAEQVTEQLHRKGEMSLAARLADDCERLNPLYGESCSRIVIITAQEKKVTLSELEQRVEGITVLNAGKAGAAEEDKNSDAVIYDVFNGRELEFPDYIVI